MKKLNKDLGHCSVIAVELAKTLTNNKIEYEVVDSYNFKFYKALNFKWIEDNMHITTDKYSIFTQKGKYLVLENTDDDASWVYKTIRGVINRLSK